MTKIRLLFCFVAMATLVSCGGSSSTGDKTHFRGRFINYNGEYVEFFIPDGDEYIEIPVEVADDGTFDTDVQFKENYYDLAIFADKFMFRVSMEQGKSYEAEFDLSEDGVESNYRFIGEGEKETEFLRQLFMKYAYSGDYVEPLVGKVSTFGEYWAARNSIVDSLRILLKATGNRPFIKYHEADLGRRDLEDAMFYPFVRVAADGTYIPEQECEKYLSGLKSIDDETFAGVSAAFTMCVAYSHTDVDFTEIFKAVESFPLTRERKDAIMSGILKNAAGFGKLYSLKEAVSYYKENSASPDQSIIDECLNVCSLNPGDVAPDIEFADVSGKVFHLADFAGKPLYVDLWASWCGPCCDEIPYLAKMVEKMGSNPEIQCISISIDSHSGDWTAKLESEKPSWPQYIVTEKGQNDVAGSYGISAIPRFLLFNSDGTIASVNAPRPSTPDVIKELEKLLEKEK